MAADEHDTSSSVFDADLGRSQYPGSDGEKALQKRFDTADRADRFYDTAMNTSLTERMISFVRDRQIVYVGVASAAGTPSVVPVAGEEGVVQVLDENHLAYPVTSQPGDVTPRRTVAENPSATLLFVDWLDSTVGLHVNGEAEIRERVPNAENRRHEPAATEWLVLEVEEAYIHCAKHIPQLEIETPRTRKTKEQRQVLPGLTDTLVQFVDTRLLTFLATADSTNETDVSPRLGPQGFVQVRDETTLAWPEFRGNGVHASLGNMLENPEATLLFGDWWGSDNVVKVTGGVELTEDVEWAVDLTDVDRTKIWVVMDIDEVAINRQPRFPTFSITEFDPPWGTDDPDAKNVGFFADG